MFIFSDGSNNHLFLLFYLHGHSKVEVELLFGAEDDLVSFVYY